MTKDNRRAASPVQAGIDPLVAEIEVFQDTSYFDLWCVRRKGELRFGEGFHVQSKDEADALAALLRSQAERIAALEVERDTAWSDSEHDKESALSAERLGREYLDRALAAESLLAEAREALTKVRNHLVIILEYSPNSIAVSEIDATLSRLKQGEKGGDDAA